MEVERTELRDVYMVKPQVMGDHRGYFIETYSKRVLRDMGLNANFVQDNESYTAKKGTLRGLHFQNNPYSQLKLVRVLQGAVMDVAVDLRRGSPAFGRWVAVELTAANKHMFWIPRGFAHGFLTLTDDVIFAYKADNYYAPLFERNVRFDDPDIHIDWGIENPVLSKKDTDAPMLCDCDFNFKYREVDI